ncbi:hypothetical protein ACIPSE_45235 [Streptomyces sp. NPDC090106]|uniref:hypothetical protein n=1 Tax=Streptomyces sp. NPDC090106 TaxID=3365946 RepID=UPI0038279E89
MAEIEPTAVPLTPIYTITVTATGAASVNGEEITGPGFDPAAARIAALAEIRIKAAFAGRPVRVIAKEADGAAWPLIVAEDGTVTTLGHPHPTPAPEPAMPPMPAPRVPQFLDAGEPTVAMRREERPDWKGQDPERIARTASGLDLWSASLPAEFGLLWAQLTTRVQAGAYPDGATTAGHLETALKQQYGPHHAYSINIASVRAWLTLLSATHTNEWAEATELLVETAQRRHEAKAPDTSETARTIRNAHGSWLLLIQQDGETARDLADALLTLLAFLPAPEHRRRAQSVVGWIESGAA